MALYSRKLMLSHIGFLADGAGTLSKSSYLLCEVTGVALADGKTVATLKYSLYGSSSKSRSVTAEIYAAGTSISKTVTIGTSMKCLLTLTGTKTGYDDISDYANASFSYSVKNFFKRKLVPVTMFDNMDFTYMGPYDGHNLKVLERNLKRAKNANKPVVFHVRTIKGKGYGPAENDTTGYWHGVTPFNISDGSPKKQHPGFISWSHYFANLTFDYLKNNENLFLITPATLKGSGLDECFKSFPNRCMDVGIAEEHAATFSGAIALQGFHPVLSIYSTFLQRAYDEISHDCARMKIDMTILVDRAGMVGKNGDTHQGIYDAAYLKSIPGVTLAMPSTKSIAHTLYEQSLGHHGVFAIRYSREMVAEDEADPIVPLEFGRFLKLRDGSGKTALLAVGQLGRKLAAMVDENGLDVDVIDPVYLVPVLREEAEKLLDYETVFVYDPYSTIEGFARELSGILMELGYKGKVVLKAIGNDFVPQDSLQNQLGMFDLTPEAVFEALKEVA